MKSHSFALLVFSFFLLHDVYANSPFSVESTEEGNEFVSGKEELDILPLESAGLDLGSALGNWEDFSTLSTSESHSVKGLDDRDGAFLQSHGAMVDSVQNSSRLENYTVYDQRKLAPIDPSWFVDPQWIVQTNNPTMCAQVNTLKQLTVAKCSLGKSTQQFSYDPVNARVINNGTCMRPETATTGRVLFGACDPPGVVGMQTVNLDLQSRRMSFPFYQGRNVTAGRYDTPIYCLETLSDGTIRTKLCSTALTQRFESPFYFSFYSRSRSGLCLGRNTANNVLNLFQCNMNDFNQQFLYDTLKKQIIVRSNKMCLRAGSTLPLIFAACPTTGVINQNMTWELTDLGQVFSPLNSRCIQVPSSAQSLAFAPCQNINPQILVRTQQPFVCDDGNACTREGFFEGQCVYLDEYGYPDQCNGDGCIPGLINCDDGKGDTVNYCKPADGCQFIKLDALDENNYDEFVNLVNAIDTLPTTTTRPLAIAPANANLVVSTQQTPSIFYEELPSLAEDPYNLNKILTWIRTKADEANNTGLCWKRSYGRGEGHGIDTCPEGLEKIDLLCYSPCPAEFTRFGVDCYQVCKDGWRDDGLFCRLAEYSRGGGYGWQPGDGSSLGPALGRCQNEYGVGNCEQYGSIIYPKCAPGFYAVGCCICRPVSFDCAEQGYSSNQVDLSCGKQILLGDPIPLQCPSNEEQDGLLCYPPCESGYSGVGPVCWGDCAEGLIDCGAACAQTAEICALEAYEMVRAPLVEAANLATIGATKVAEQTPTTVEIAENFYEGGSKSGKIFLQAAKMLQTVQVNGGPIAASYVQKVRHKRVRAAQNVATSLKNVQGSVEATVRIATRTLTSDFQAITSPEIYSELKSKLNPLNLDFIIKVYSKVHLGAWSTSDAWNIGQTVGGFVSMVDLPDVTSLISAFATPLCSDVDDLEYKDLGWDWDLCTTSSDCENDCCSGMYSDGILKCTPTGGTGFNPDFCVSPDPNRNLPIGSECRNSKDCITGCCSNGDDQRQCIVQYPSEFNSDSCTGRPPIFSLGPGKACESSLECGVGCCTGKFSKGNLVCTPFDLGFDPVANQCVGQLYINWAPCQFSSSCQSGCCSKKFSDDGKLKCTPLNVGFDPVSNECMDRTVVTSNLQLFLDASDPKSYPRTGSLWRDLSPNAFNGTLVGSPVWANGYFTFVAGSIARYVDMNTKLSAESFSVGAWFRTTAPGTKMILTKEVPGGLPWNYRLRLDGGTIVGGIAQGASSYVIRSSASTYNDGRWYLVMFSRDDASWCLWLNGLQLGCGADPYSGSIANDQELWIGCSSNVGNRMQFVGDIGQVFVYDAVLTNAQMIQNYDVTKHKYV